LKSPFPEHGEPRKKRVPKCRTHITSKQAKALLITTAIAVCLAATCWNSPAGSVEQNFADCRDGCSKEQILSLARKQVKDAKGREALLQSELKAMNGKASLLPNALSQAEKCNKQLIVNDKVCKKQRQDLERALEQHTQAFEACAGLSKEKVNAKDLPGQAAVACADAALRLKRWQTLERRMEEREKVLDAFAGRGEACWGNLHQAKEEVRKWQLRCATISAVCTALCGSVIGVYRRWLTRKMWRWTAEKARLGAALKLAEAGLSKRGGRRVS